MYTCALRVEHVSSRMSLGATIVETDPYLTYLDDQATRYSGNTGYNKIGGGGGAFIRDNTVYTQAERLSHLEPSRL